MDVEDGSEIYIEVQSCLGRRIRTTKKHWRFITERKHLEIAGKEAQVQQALRAAERVRVASETPTCFFITGASAPTSYALSAGT